MLVTVGQRLRARWAVPCGREIDRALLIAAIGGAYALAALGITIATGKYQYFQFVSYTGIAGLLAGLTLLGIWGAHALQYLQDRAGESYLHRLQRDIREHILEPRRFLMYAAPFVVLPVFIAAVTSVKSQIPFIHPFGLDVAFERIDRLVHFGVEPWRITHAVFGSDLATVVISYLYNAWMGVMWVFLLWHVYSLSRPIERHRYLVAFMLCWIVIGTAAAIGLSSAGPCYFDRVTGLTGPYGPLMDLLYATEERVQAWPGPWTVWALEAQELLWTLYQKDLGHIGSGISAMPSMHVSIAVLMALSGFRHSRRLGWLMTGYAVVIQIGSVHLAWHYAIDGYLAAVLTVLVWRFSGWLLRRTGLDQP